MTLNICVRSRVKRPTGQWETEWMEKVHSWKKAWQIVDNCGVWRVYCHKWSTGGEFSTWFLDIGGAAEQEERKARMTYLLSL